MIVQYINSDLKTGRGRVEKTTKVNALVKSTSRDGVKLQDGWCKPVRQVKHPDLSHHQNKSDRKCGNEYFTANSGCHVNS